MPALKSRAELVGARRPEAVPPARGPAAPAPAAARLVPRPLSPAAAPEQAVARLVETGTGPGAAGSRRAVLAHIQRTHGNRYAAQVVAEFRARESEGRPPAEPLQPEPATAPRPSAEVAAPAPATPAPAAPRPTAKTAAEPAALKPPPAPTAARPAAPAAPVARAPVPPPVAAPAAKPAAPTAAPEPAPTARTAPPAAGPASPGAGAPTSPAADPAFLAVIARARAVVHQQGHNSPATRKAAEAQAAAPGPPNEVASQAATAQVAKMDAQEPAPFDRAGFKAALVQKIAEITPKNLKEADEFKKSGGAASVKGAVTTQVAAGKDAAQGGIKAASTEAPDTSVGQPKPVTPMPPTQAGPPPAEIGAAGAAPKPKSEQEVSLQAESQGLDRQMADAHVTSEQLEKSNEPEFQSAAQAKGEAQAHAAQAPAAYRQQEQSVVAGAQAQAAASAATQTQQMHGLRQQQFGLISGDQARTQQADQQARAEVARRIEEIFQGTRTRVEERLGRLDKEVNELFDKGAEQARQEFETWVDERMTAWKLERYLATPGGSLLWIKDQLLGLPEEVNAFYSEGRALYVQRMDGVIDQVASAVETGLDEAKQLIGAGRAEVQRYVASLPESLRQVGEQAATGIQGKFDSLRQSVDEKGNQLVDQLAQKYVENLGKLDERIGEMKAGNRGLVDKARDQIKGVIDTIIGLKNMLLGVLAKAAAAIDKIIADPIGFLGNLVAGVKAGLNNFVSNIGTHLKKGLMEWLFGALAGAGLQLPETLDLKGIISIVLQVLGLTYANFRARAVAIVGEPIVKALEEAAEVFKVIVTEGIPGLWRFIKEKLADLKSMVLDAILDFVRDRIIIAGITWLVGLLNPASAFVKACKAIYDVVMFFINRGSQILALVNAVVDSVAAIAEGAIGVAATWVENALARAVPVAIGFLASLLGLGDPSAPVKNTINKARSPVNAAMDWLIHQAVKLVKAAGKFIGGLFGGKKDQAKKDPEPQEADPQKAAKLEAGLAAFDQFEASAAGPDGKLSHQEAEKVAADVKARHPVFKSVRVANGGETWDYEYEASPAHTRHGKTTKAAGEGKDKAENWDEVQKVLGKKVGVTLPSGYDYFEREGRTYIRRREADDKKWQRIGVDENEKVVLGEGRAERISTPGALAKELGGAEEGYQAHHLVPDAVVRSHPLPQEAIRRGEPPYNLDSGSNGIKLPSTEAAKKKTPNLPMHSGSHPKWNAHAALALDEAVAKLRSKYGKLDGVPGGPLTSAVKRVESQLRSDITSWKEMK